MSERTCAVMGCDSPHYGLDLCRLHYRRFKKHGSTDLPQRVARGCQVDGCHETHYCRGYCELHYGRFQRTGSPNLRAAVARSYICAGCDETHDRDPDKLGGTPPKWCPTCKRGVREIARAKWHEANGPERVTDYTCRLCGFSFCNIVPDGRFRSVCAGCQGRARLEYANQWGKRNPEQHAEMRARMHQRRRAQKKGARAERVDRRIVFALGGWTCHLCCRASNPDLRYPDPMSASVDHVVPLLPGRTPEERATMEHGEHTYENTRPAHLRCNLRKSNRMIERIPS